MAGLTKTQSDALPFGNLTKDPTALPKFATYGGYAPQMNNGAGQTTSGGAASFWNSWQYFGGDYSQSSTMGSYVTIVHVVNLTSPIVIGCFIGRYSNQSTADHKMKITVDGTPYILEMDNFEGRMVVGSTYLNVRGTTNALNGRSAPSGMATNQYHYAQSRWDTVEQPMMQYQDGNLMLYAEDSLKFEDYLSASTNTTSVFPYSGVQYNHLGTNA